MLQFRKVGKYWTITNSVSAKEGKYKKITVGKIDKISVNRIDREDEESKMHYLDRQNGGWSFHLLWLGNDNVEFRVSGCFDKLYIINPLQKCKLNPMVIL